VLLEHLGEAQCGKKNKDGNAPLHLACMAGKLEVVKLLLRTSAGRRSVFAKNKQGQTPLHLALRFTDIMTQLVPESSQPNCALTVSVQITSHAAIDAVDNEGATPLMLALNMKPTLFEAAQLLLSRGAKAGVVFGCASLSRSDV